MRNRSERPTQTSAVDIGAYQAWLFDLDGVLTKTATVHAAAWKQAFDAFLDEESERSGRTFASFDPVADYEQYVDGEPRADGVRNFLTARGITLPEGSDDDHSDARTVQGLGNRKNSLVLTLMVSNGVAVYDGSIQLVKALRARGVRTAVVSASENTAAALDAAGIAELFDARIDGHVVKERHLAGKPAPDSYLEGAKALSVEPGDAVVVEDALAGVESGRAGHFGLVIGVNHHDYAGRLRAHGADVVVTDLAELLDKTVAMGRVDRRHGLARTAGRGENVDMPYVANVASSVLFVRELDRSVSFYTEVFGCETAFHTEGGALLLSPGGFQIYLIDKGGREPGITGSVGVQNLMWATDSADGLKHFEQLLKQRGSYTYTHSGGEVTFVEGRDPDGSRVVIAYPSPQQQPRSVLDGRLYN